MLGAILGYDKGSYLSAFQDDCVDVAISIQQKPRSLRIAFNDTETKGVKLFRTTRHTQIRREMLANVRYRIFFRHPDDIIQGHLTDLIRAHQSVYTVSLGQASLLADFAFIAVVEPKAISFTDAVEVVTVTPFSVGRPRKTADAAPILLNSLPRHMTSERIVTAYQDVVYDARKPSLLISPTVGSELDVRLYDFGELGVVVPL
jgi:CRISPR-associated protein Cas5h